MDLSDRNMGPKKIVTCKVNILYMKCLIIKVLSMLYLEHRLCTKALFSCIEG